jgi:hypothetical protein
MSQSFVSRGAAYHLAKFDHLVFVAVPDDGLGQAFPIMWQIVPMHHRLRRCLILFDRPALPNQARQLCAQTDDLPLELANALDKGER